MYLKVSLFYNYLTPFMQPDNIEEEKLQFEKHKYERDYILKEREIALKENWQIKIPNLLPR